MDVRTQILVGTQTLDESSERLVNTHRIAVETETIGENVLGEMNTQKQTLERARDNV
jgi:vesicle transport through interaction with t-SNAREs protein 1